MKTSKIILLTGAVALLTGGLFIYRAHAEDTVRRPVLQRIIKYLGLTDDQTARIKTELQAEKGNLLPLIKNLHDTRQDLRDVINQPGASEIAIRAAAAKVAAVESDLAVERAKLSGKIRLVLTDEQIQKVKDAQAKVDDFVLKALKTIGDRLDEK